jgi:predicted enzyme related to lactoylglutathione lyase
MKIEHFAYMVEDPGAVARWYCENLGFEIRRSNPERPWAHWLADSSGSTMIEIYNNARCTVPDYASQDPLLMHLAFVCDEVEKTLERLCRSGCSVETPPERTPAGDYLAMLRDPWGLSIQLCQRAQPMV